MENLIPLFIALLVVVFFLVVKGSSVVKKRRERFTGDSAPLSGVGSHTWPGGGHIILSDQILTDAPSESSTGHGFSGGDTGSGGSFPEPQETSSRFDGVDGWVSGAISVDAGVDGGDFGGGGADFSGDVGGGNFSSGDFSGGDFSGGDFGGDSGGGDFSGGSDSGT